MRVRRSIAIGAAIVVTLCGGLGYAGYAAFSRPWWDQQDELDRIFAGSPVRLSNHMYRVGNRLCLDACPATDAGIIVDPNTYQNLTTELAAALASRGYTVANNFEYVSGSGQKITAPIQCQAPNNGMSGSSTYWECRYSAHGPRYHVWGRIQGSPTTAPSPTYQQFPDTVADHLPGDTQIIYAGIEIETNRQ